MSTPHTDRAPGAMSAAAAAGPGHPVAAPSLRPRSAAAPRQMAHKAPRNDADDFGARYGVGGCYIVARGVLFALVAAGGLVALFLVGAPS